MSSNQQKKGSLIGILSYPLRLNQCLFIETLSSLNSMSFRLVRAKDTVLSVSPKTTLGMLFRIKRFVVNPNAWLLSVRQTFSFHFSLFRSAVPNECSSRWWVGVEVGSCGRRQIVSSRIALRKDVIVQRNREQGILFAKLFLKNYMNHITFALVSGGVGM